MSKNNFKEQLKAIFQKFNTDPSIHGVKFEEELKFEAEAKLQDGTPIYTTGSAFEVGADCYTMDADGNPVPCAAGEYVLEDGTMIMVGDDGKIAEVGSMEDKEEEMSKDDMLAVIEKLSQRISVLETERAEATTKLASEAEKALKFSSEVSKLKIELSSLKKQPATGSVKDKTVEHSFGKQTKPKEEKHFMQMTLKERILANMPKNN
jgi:hypothetical protein